MRTRYRIAYIAAGAANMYCGSCLHDNALAAALKKLGHKVWLVPTYTPLRTDEEDVTVDKIFYSGLNVYFEQTVPGFRFLPSVLLKVFENRQVLKIVSRIAGMTDPTSFGAVTLSVLQGSDGYQKRELQKLISFLKTVQPDVVHLTNSMFVGTAREIKAQLGTPVLCSLQGEDIFLNGLPEPYRTEVLHEIELRATDVDTFVATSAHYAAQMSGYLNIPEEKIGVVRLGLNLEGHGGHAVTPPGDEFVLGYLARISPEKGLHLLAEALPDLIRRNPARRIRLRVAGYMEPRHRKYLSQVRRQLTTQGVDGHFEYLGEVSRAEKIRFLRSLHALSVPSPYEEPKGLYVLEALANSVPVVQPRHGIFPELLEATDGGLLFEPNSIESLVREISRLVSDEPLRRRLGRDGQKSVFERYSAEKMASETLALYTRNIGAQRAQVPRT